MKNLLLAEREKLEKLNYVRKAEPESDYWADFAYKSIKNYLNCFDDCFNLIFIGDDYNEYEGI